MSKVDRPQSLAWVLFVVVGGLGACRPATLVAVTSDFDLLSLARPSLTEDGVVLAVKQQALVVGEGGPLTTLDLAAHALTIVTAMPSRPARIRNGGEIALVADRGGVMGCPGNARGAYRLATGGGGLTTLLEVCPASGDATVDRDVGLSPGGVVAFSQIVSGAGAVYRGPAAGPVEVLRSGSGTFYNTQSLDVNDDGVVAVEFEYVDGFAGGLMRAVFALDTPEQAKEASDTAIEKMGIGVQPPVAINGAGEVAFSLNTTVSMPIGGTTYTVEPGVYRASPTLFNTPKALTQIASLDGGYCRFGTVDIDDAGQVVFEASREGGLACVPGGLVPSYDGIFDGPDAEDNLLVGFGDPRLEGHQYFDSIRLGELNNAGQVSFLTEYSEPLVAPVVVWRLTPGEAS